MIQARLSEEVAKNYLEMGAALDRGGWSEDMEKYLPKECGKTKLEDLVPVFASIYRK